MGSAPRGSVALSSIHKALSFEGPCVADLLCEPRIKRTSKQGPNDSSAGELEGRGRLRVPRLPR